MATQSLLHVIVLLVTVAGSFAALPNGWKPCPRSANDFESCLKKEVRHAITTLLNGDKKLEVVPLDPLEISELKIPQSPGPVSLDLKVTNLKNIGIKNIQIDKIKGDWKSMEYEAQLPKLVTTCDYALNGKVLVLPINGNGKGNFTYDQVKLKVNVQIKDIKKSGKKYFQVEKINLQIKPKRLYIHLTNLFNGDKTLGDNMNLFLNENWELIFAELSPAISQGVSQALMQIANAVLSKIPANEIDVK